MKTMALMVLSLMAFVSAPAIASCGKNFDGMWDFGPVQSQGQYTKALFIHNSANGVVFTQTETGTKMSGSMIMGTLFDIEYTDSNGSVRATRIDGNTCRLKFGRPKVNTDKLGASRNNISREAILKRKGNRISWCWTERGHLLGTCVTYKKTG
ncbi:MAG: hypothetical protein WBF87_12575 [Mesorhizobium sp.]